MLRFNFSANTLQVLLISCDNFSVFSPESYFSNILTKLFDSILFLFLQFVVLVCIPIKYVINFVKPSLLNQWTRFNSLSLTSLMNDFGMTCSGNFCLSNKIYSQSKMSENEIYKIPYRSFLFPISFVSIDI